MSNKKLTVVMPAAGKGSRLGLPYPKEIMQLEKDKSLIDYSFDFFRNYDRSQVEFVIVINESKTEIVKYLSKYNKKYNISFTYQNPNEHEYTGAIKSAYHLFGDYNVVLLPDTILKLKNNMNLYQTVIRNLDTKGFTFFYKKEQNPLMLSTKGSLYVDNNFIKLYEDKPIDGFHRFNAYWCSFAFTKKDFNLCMSFMEKSTLKENVDLDEIKLTPIFNSLGIEVENYLDLGTWSEIKRFKEN
jgi:UTP-glucose-1-phosphate uridylyltransferase